MTPSAFVVASLSALWLATGAPVLAAEALPHSSGGIGDDDPLAQLVGDYNVQFVFATRGSGEYLADVDVQIADAQDKVLLATRSPGPLFYVTLPVGRYRVRAEYAGQAQTRAVVIGHLRRQNLFFYWPGAEAAAGK